MKVNIGKYRNYIGPFQLAELLCFWTSRDEYGNPPEWVQNFGEWLQYGKSSGTKDEKYTRLYFFLNWVHSKKKQKVKVNIEEQDLWDMYSTLSHVILPMLNKMAESKFGTPFISDEDVPEEIRSTNAGPYDDSQGELDEFFEARWAYVLSEMIFAFDSTTGHNKDWEDDFYSALSGEHDYTLSDVKRKEMEIYEDRIQNGFRLFGVYYQCLWT